MGSGACRSCCSCKMGRCYCNPCCPEPEAKIIPKPVSPLPDRPRSRLPSSLPHPPLVLVRPVKAHRKRSLPEPSVNIVENCVVVWLDLSIDDDSAETEEIEKQLQQVSSTVITCTDPKECFTFIDGVKNEKVFVVVSGTPTEEFISKAQDSSKVDFVYVLGSNQEPHMKWSNKYPQVRDSYKSIQRLCQKLKKDIKNCDHDMIGYGFTEGSSLSTTTENDQNMLDDETTEELYWDTETDDNQSVEDGETTDKSSSSILVKSSPTMAYGGTTGETSSTIAVKSSGKMVDDKLTGGASSEIPTESSSTMVCDKTTEESFSTIPVKSSGKIVDGKMTGGASSKIPAGSSSTMVGDKTTGESSSTIPVKSSGKMGDGKLTGGTSSKTPAKNSSTTGDGQTTGESQLNITIGSAPEQVLLMYDQLFREIVLSLKEEEMDSICQFCRMTMKDDQNELNFIAKLETKYPDHPPIRWYSMQACLYKILNKALRTHGYDILYELRVFIRHLHEDIVAYQKKTPWNNIPLYRGQGLEKADFEYIRLHKGALMRFSNFLSTSASRDEALRFARDALDGKRVAVLMKIKVNKNIPVPFAYIREISAFKTEDEWLFSMGSVFCIGQTKRRHDGIWVINLTAMNDNNEHLVTMKEYFKESMKDKNVYLNFARLMHQLAYWKQSKDLYSTSLKTENEWDRQAVIYNNLGLVSSELEEYEKALEYYNQSLNLELQNGGPHSKDLTSTYNNIGTLYYKQGEMDLAMENFKLAMEAYNGTPDGSEEIMATLHNNIASLRNIQAKYKETLENNERCMNIRMNIFPEFDPSLAITCNNIAITYYRQQSFAEAVKYAEKAVQIDNLVLRPDHPQTKIHEKNLKRFKELALSES